MRTVKSGKAKKKPAPKTPNLQASRAAADASLKDKQRYVKGYLQVVGNLYKRYNFTQEQARLADLAYKRKLPPSGFVALIRQRDPQYPKTQEFKNRHTEASDVWKKFRPNRPMPSEYSSRYIRSGMNKMQLIEKVQRSMSAQNALAQPLPSNTSYKTMRKLLNDSHEKVHGSAADPLLHRMIFSPKMTERDINESFANLFGGKEVFKWMQNTPPQNDAAIRQSLFSKLEPPVKKTSSAPSPFITQAQNAFDIGVDDMGSNLIASEI